MLIHSASHATCPFQLLILLCRCVLCQMHGKTVLHTKDSTRGSTMTATNHDHKRYNLSIWRFLKSTPLVSFYRAMHFSAFAWSWDRMSSVCPSVRPSVTLVICDHTGWKSWKLIARTISPTASLFVAKRRSTYSRGNMGKFGGD